MVDKKVFMIGMIVLINLFLIAGVLAENSFCCERLKGSGGQAGAWCQNAPESECFDGNKCGKSENELCRMVPTSCESTGYCKLGTCINNEDGNCMANTPESSCNVENGCWKGEDLEDLQECQLGCCTIGDQVAFVTQTKCGYLSKV